MAIQNINLGATPTGVGGDTLRSTAVKINENFNNSGHAASKLIGLNSDNIANVGKLAEAVYSFRSTGAVLVGTNHDCDTFTVGRNYTAPNTVNGVGWAIIHTKHLNGEDKYIQYSEDVTKAYGDLRFRINTGSGYSSWKKFYHEGIVTVDGNGFLKASSPIVKLYADKAEYNEEAQNQNIVFIKNGVGDYTLKNTTGLSANGWYLELPKDLNGNPKVAVTLSEVNGTISLKSYKRIFSMDTFTFEPDLENPLDIPSDRWVDIRLNELEDTDKGA